MTYGTLPPIAYPSTSKWLHWLVAVSVLTTAVVAITMVNFIVPGPTHDALYNFHKSLGFLILALMTLRLVNRLAVGAPMAEPSIEPWQQTLSSAVHGTLYVLLFAMPVVGYIANSAYGASTPFFGLFDVPAIIGKNEQVSTVLFTVHRWVGFLVILLVLLHISGALYHYFIRGDGVLQRMLPRALGGLEHERRNQRGQLRREPQCRRSSSPRTVCAQ